MSDPYKNYLTRLHDEVMIQSGLPSFSFEIDEQGRLLNPYSENYIDDFNKYCQNVNLFGTKSYLAEVADQYQILHDENFFSVTRKKSAGSIWTLACIAVGEQHLSDSVSGLASVTAEDMRILWPGADKKIIGGYLIELALMEGVIYVSECGTRTFIPQNCTEAKPRLRYNTVPPTRGLGKKVKQSFPYRIRTRRSLVTSIVPLPT